MAITITSSKIHWNYFLALEQDLEKVARYVEFSSENLGVYSIELARLLFAASSEVEVVSKLLCKSLDRSARPNNIRQIQSVLVKNIPEIVSTKVFVPRYGLSFVPWERWGTPECSPNWWGAYNSVKHERDANFNKATLQNVLDAMGALLVVVFNYYRTQINLGSAQANDVKGVMHELHPQSALLRLDEESYYGAVQVGNLEW